MKEQRYEKIVELVRECGQLVKNADRQHLHIDSKAGHANFVTEYDKKVQERLRAGLCAIMPDAHFIGEEGSSQMFSPVGAFPSQTPTQTVAPPSRNHESVCRHGRRNSCAMPENSMNSRNTAAMKRSLLTFCP